MTPGLRLGPAHVLALRRALGRAKALRRPRTVQKILIRKGSVRLDLSCGHSIACGPAAQSVVRVGQGWPCIRCPPLRNPGKSP